MSNTTQVTFDLDFTPYLSRRTGIDPESGDEYTEPVTIEDVVIDGAVRQFVTGLDRDVRREVADQIRAIRAEVIREQLTPIVIEALTGPITRTNSYGEAIGTQTTLRDLITTDVQSALKLTPRSQRSGRSSYDMTPATKVMYEEVDRAVQKEIAGIIAQVKDETREAIKSAASEAIAKAAG
jgi:hypothetical protein